MQQMPLLGIGQAGVVADQVGQRGQAAAGMIEPLGQPVVELEGDDRLPHLAGHLADVFMHIGPQLVRTFAVSGAGQGVVDAVECFRHGGEGVGEHADRRIGIAHRRLDLRRRQMQHAYGLPELAPCRKGAGRCN